jgi:hypothetical protein
MSHVRFSLKRAFSAMKKDHPPAAHRTAGDFAKAGIKDMNTTFIGDQDRNK